MKNYLKFIAGASALLILTGCSSSDKAPQSSVSENIVTEAETDEPTDPPAVELPDSMPLLSIRTADQSENVLDFVTKPVNQYVAKSISSWTPNYTMPPEPYYEDCFITLTDKDKTVKFQDDTAKVKVRGNWTTNYEKKPLRIKFDEKHSMLGLNEGSELKNWVLLAEYKDGSMLRNKAALNISKELLGRDGYYSADCELVEVEINDEYWGVYLLTEQQQVNKHRVDITEPEKDYTGTDIGYFLEFDGYYKNEDELHSFYVTYADNAPLVPFDGNGGSGRTMTCLPHTQFEAKDKVGITIKSEINSPEQHDYIASFVENVYKIMYSAAYEDKAYVFNADFSEISETGDMTPREAVEAVVDVDSLADTYIISELACDADIYWSSFYMDIDFGENGSKKLTFEAPWDFDSSMGNKERCPDGTGFYAANIVPDVNGGPGNGGLYETINPWLAVLIYEDWFQDIVREKWTSAYDDGVFERVINMIDSDKTALSSAFERNYKKWDNIRKNSAFSNELSKNAAKCKDHEQAAAFLSQWVQSRVDFLNENWHN